MSSTASSEPSGRRDFAVAAQFGGDGVQRRRVGHAVDRLAQHAGGGHGGRQRGVVLVRDDDGGAVERLEAAARRAPTVQAVVGEVLRAGGDVVDAEDQASGPRMFMVPACMSWSGRAAAERLGHPVGDVVAGVDAVVEAAVLHAAFASVKTFSSRFGLLTSCS